MTYLKSYLKGDAARAVEGLSLTSTNYDIAVTLLKERFGKKHVVQNAYTEALLKMPAAENEANWVRQMISNTEIHSTLIKHIRQFLK